MRFSPVSTLIAATAALSFTACTSERGLTVQRPAEVSVPANARRVVLLDRTQPRSGFSNSFEGWTSRESGMDKELGQEMNAVLQEALGANGRFEVVTAPGRYEGSGTGVLPEPMSWDTIIQVCSRMEADILIAFEALDTDVNIDQRERIIQDMHQGRPIGRARTEYYATRKTTLKYGWRVYDRRGRTILDMFTDRSTRNDERVGINKYDAKNGLPDKRGVIEELGALAAHTYARRFAPTSAVVERILYTGGDRRLRDAEKLTRRNDWEGAIRIWETMLTDPKAKLRGKACYNMAVAHEMMGDLSKAREVARRSTDEFGNKWGKGYAAEIEGRMKDEVRVQEERQLIDAQ